MAEVGQSVALGTCFRSFLFRCRSFVRVLTRREGKGGRLGRQGREGGRYLGEIWITR